MDLSKLPMLTALVATEIWNLISLLLLLWRVCINSGPFLLIHAWSTRVTPLFSFWSVCRCVLTVLVIGCILLIKRNIALENSTWQMRNLFFKITSGFGPFVRSSELDTVQLGTLHHHLNFTNPAFVAFKKLDFLCPCMMGMNLVHVCHLCLFAHNCQKI